MARNLRLGRMSFIVLLIGGPPAHAADEVAVFSVEVYGESPACCPDCGLRPWLHETNDAIVDQFDEWSADLLWDVTWQWKDEQVDPQDWVDDDECADTWCHDDASPYGADAADVAFAMSHGGSVCWNSGAGSDFHFVAGSDDHGVCNIDANVDMRFGDDDDDLEMVFVFACHSLDDCSYANGAFETSDPTRLHGDDLRLYGGFRGKEYDSPWRVVEVADFVALSREDFVGLNWLAFLTETIGLDQCPAVVTWGTSINDATDFYIGGGFADRFNNTPHQSKRHFTVAGCTSADS